MPLTTCRDCGAQVSTNGMRCPACGCLVPWLGTDLEALAPARKPATAGDKGCGIGCLVLIVFAIWIGVTGNRQSDALTPNVSVETVSWQRTPMGVNIQARITNANGVPVNVSLVPRVMLANDEKKDGWKDSEAYIEVPAKGSEDAPLHQNLEPRETLSVVEAAAMIYRVGKAP